MSQFSIGGVKRRRMGAMLTIAKGIPTPNRRSSSQLSEVTLASKKPPSSLSTDVPRSTAECDKTLTGEPSPSESDPVSTTHTETTMSLRAQEQRETKLMGTTQFLSTASLGSLSALELQCTPTQSEYPSDESFPSPESTERVSQSGDARPPPTPAEGPPTTLHKEAGGTDGDVPKSSKRARRASDSCGSAAEASLLGAPLTRVQPNGGTRDCCLYRTESGPPLVTGRVANVPSSTLQDDVGSVHDAIRGHDTGPAAPRGLQGITAAEACSALMMLKIIENNGLMSSLRESFAAESDPYPLTVVLEIDIQELLKCSVMCRNILSAGWGPNGRSTVTYLRTCFGFVLQRVILEDEVEVAHHLINLTVAPRNGFNFRMLGSCALPRRFHRCVMMRARSEEHHYVWCRTGRACCGQQQRLASSVAFSPPGKDIIEALPHLVCPGCKKRVPVREELVECRQTFEVLLENGSTGVGGSASAALVTLDGEILRRARDRSLLTEGVLLDMVLLEIPALREGPPHGSRSKWRLPEFLCLSVPTLTAPERVIQLPDPRTVDDPIAAILDGTAVTGVNDLPIIALLSSLLSTSTPQWAGNPREAVMDHHRRTECSGDDSLTDSVAAARQVCRKGAAATSFGKGAALEEAAQGMNYVDVTAHGGACGRRKAFSPPAAEGQLRSHAEELSCIDVHRLIWLATAVATIRQSHLQEVQIDRADVSKAYEVLRSLSQRAARYPNEG
ncbi:hypothetical protein FOZ60_009977 [Perkinsus olseni]|uniref:Uncharacterized protein n=1 Tax=Perkinsus olseni TaxID=32597 RepID=A0A7J6PCF4_PEROL|nr:hypothetical protein FOZ60_009977 [Perkinsus olseni]